MRRQSQSLFPFVVFGFLLALAYLFPIHTHPLRVFYPDVFAILGLILCTTYFVLSGENRVHIPLLIALPLGIVAWILLQLLVGLGTDVHDVTMPALYIGLAALAIILGASLSAGAGVTYAYGNATKHSGAERLCFTLAIAHVLVALLSLGMQHIQIADFDLSPWVMHITTNGTLVRPFANVAQPNQLALAFCLGLASLWWLYQRGLLLAWVAALLVAALIWGLTLTQSRIGWVIVPLFAVMAAQTKKDERRISGRFLLGILIFYVACIVALPHLATAIGLTGGDVAEHIGGRSERRVLYSQAWRMALDHPWLGVGWFGFCREQVAIAADFPSTVYAEHSHNLILNFAAELGLPATILIVSGLGWWFWQACVKAEKSLPVRFASLCFIAVGVHSMVEFPLWYAYVLLPFAILMGMVHQLRWPSHGVRIAPVAVWSLMAIACLTIVLLVVDYQRLRAGYRALSLESSGRSAPQAAMQKPAWTAFPQFFDYFKLSKISPHEGMSADEIAFVERMSHRFGFINVINKSAEVYVLNGRPKEAVRAVQTMQRLDTYNYPVYYDYWQKKAELDARYREVFRQMPARDAP